MKLINAIRMGGTEILPLVEGGKGVAVSNGVTAGHWAAAGGAGTFSGVNPDSYDAQGRVIPQIYHGKTRRDRHEELITYAIDGGVAQAERAYDISGGKGRIHTNVLWEMGGAERVVTGILERTKGIVNGITCGAGMPYRLGEIAAKFNVHYYPIVSSGRAFAALWKRAYSKFADLLGGVVYEDPWLAGGHNGLSNSEDPNNPETPFPRVLALRKIMREFGLGETPIIMAGGVWALEEWEDWIGNPELGPIAFQFGSRALLTKESPIGAVWKQKLLSLLVKLPSHAASMWLGKASIFAAMTEDDPDPDNRILLDPEEPDGAYFTYHITDDLRRRADALRGAFSRHVKPWRVQRLSPTLTMNHGHPCGTCRFGEDPATSVLDRNNRTHDVENLYVVDASFMPRSGAINPSLTIAANALRSAAPIAARSSD